MKKKSQWTLLAIAALLALVLTLGLAHGQRPQAQEAETGAAPAAPAGDAARTDAEPAEPDRDGPGLSSAGPGYVAPQGVLPEPEDEINTTVSLRVAGSMLRPREDNVSYNWDSGGGCVYATSGSTDTVWNTPIYLPQGSTVTQMRMYVDDTSILNTTGYFSIYDLYGNLEDEWYVTSSGTPGNAYYVVYIDPGHVIDYETYSYALNWWPTDTGSDLQLCGFRLLYTPPPGYTFLPGVMHNYAP